MRRSFRSRSRRDSPWAFTLGPPSPSIRAQTTLQPPDSGSMAAQGISETPGTCLALRWNGYRSTAETSGTFGRRAPIHFQPRVSAACSMKSRASFSEAAAADQKRLTASLLRKEVPSLSAQARDEDLASHFALRLALPPRFARERAGKAGANANGEHHRSLPCPAHCHTVIHTAAPSWRLFGCVRATPCRGSHGALPDRLVSSGPTLCGSGGRRPTLIETEGSPQPAFSRRSDRARGEGVPQRQPAVDIGDRSAPDRAETSPWAFTLGPPGPSIRAQTTLQPWQRADGGSRKPSVYPSSLRNPRHFFRLGTFSGWLGAMRM
jgi:hypothetical protein